MGTFLTVKETVKENVPVDTDSVTHKLLLLLECLQVYVEKKYWKQALIDFGQIYQQTRVFEVKKLHRFI